MLIDLLRSIDAQTDRRFAVYVACNPEQVLPPHEPYVHRVDIDLPPNTQLTKAKTMEELYDMIRNDKGQRIAAALDVINDENAYVMVVDDDDFVSSRLVEFVLSQEGEKTGWLVKKGYSWISGSNHVYEVEGFHRLCGTSIVVPAHYYAYVRKQGSIRDSIQELGGHRAVVDSAHRNKLTFRHLPFHGAIYRLGHSNASQSDVQRLTADGISLKKPGMIERGIAKIGRMLTGAKLEEGPKTRQDYPIEIETNLMREFFGRQTT
ncbi:hypothetical protein [Pseudaestuariivita rosea]|uniref:hypothetical protein n=1 Tax=Pseudaestuariivita rosea TaxID=2763263 RepID=UPI001ABB9AA1|nr:hypothetical protein [Pseudaestuariivita rosea]